ncbi:hypothetical protein CHS0354_005870 [Potamilus streckersoni]|uniref:Uncharacterized protein n=1 Tax=Potamilus streckersoni TaxID=2493646 RepID=A0AAE0W8P0_9BIVA|nr:hypothetical protein CHS0354_005870 [Potamilus streckersoni]
MAMNIRKANIRKANEEVKKIVETAIAKMGAEEEPCPIHGTSNLSMSNETTATIKEHDQNEHEPWSSYEPKHKPSEEPKTRPSEVLKQSDDLLLIQFSPHRESVVKKQIDVSSTQMFFFQIKNVISRS